MCSRPFETPSLPSSLAAAHRGFAFYVAFPESSIETRSLPALAHRYPRDFAFYVAFPKSSIPSIATCSMSLIPSSSIVLIRGKHETFDRLVGDECVHNLRDVGDRDAPVKEVIGFD